MATIVELINQFCYRVNIPAPGTYVGSTSPAALQYLSLFKFIGDNLRNRPYQWPQLKRSYSFTTETGVRKYQLPGDFYRLLNSTQWDSTNQWPLFGPVSDSTFDRRQFGISADGTRKGYRIIGANGYLHSTSPYSQRSQGLFEIDPVGSNNTDTLVMGYVSCNWIWPRDWVASTVYAAGAIRSGEGYVYRTAAGGTSGATRPSWSTGSDSDGTVTWTVYTEPYLVTSTNTDLNDSDLCLFDDDLMIEGLRWSYLKSKGLDFQQERADWENQVKSAYARYQGAVKVNMADCYGEDEDWPNIPPGSWSV